MGRTPEKLGGNSFQGSRVGLTWCQPTPRPSSGTHAVEIAADEGRRDSVTRRRTFTVSPGGDT